MSTGVDKLENLFILGLNKPCVGVRVSSRFWPFKYDEDGPSSRTQSLRSISEVFLPRLGGEGEGDLEMEGFVGGGMVSSRLLRVIGGDFAWCLGGIFAGGDNGEDDEPSDGLNDED